MKESVKNKLFEAWAYCDMKDKSTDFMLDYMQVEANIDLDEVLDFIDENSDARSEWYKQNPEWFKKYE